MIGTRLGQIAAAAAVAGMAWLYVEGLQARLAGAETEAHAARQGVADRDAIIADLREAAHQRAVAAARLDGERAGIRQALSEREIVMRKLQDENAEIRTWAAAAVPAPVVRLREHGPLTGATAYRQFLSEGAALHPARRAGEE